MSNSVFYKYKCACVYRLLLGTILILQTHQVAAFDNAIHEINIISPTSVLVVVKGHPQLPDTVSNEKALVRQLITWINEHTSFNYLANKIPEVKYLSDKQMVRVAFKKNFSSALEQNTLKILGLYNFQETVVYLSNNIDLQTKKGKGILLHELVHFLQYQYGYDKEVACVNELESMAYWLETRYLSENVQTYPLHHTNKGQRSICIS